MDKKARPTSTPVSERARSALDKDKPSPKTSLTSGRTNGIGKSATGPTLSSSRSSTAPRPLSGSTISKPPTRPVLSTSGRTRSSRSDLDSVTSGEADESKRPVLNGVSRRINVSSTSVPKVDKAVLSNIKDRRSTVTPSAVATNKMPLAHRTSTASPATKRSSIATSKPAEVAVKTPVKGSGNSPRKLNRVRNTEDWDGDSTDNGSIADKSSLPQVKTPRKLNRERIPEETEDDATDTASLTDKTSVASKRSSTMSPPKLSPYKQAPSLDMIQSVVSRIPAHVASDAEAELKMSGYKGHARSRSAIVGRPVTAPSDSRTEEQKMREIEVVADLLREATKRERLEAEIRELRTEVTELEKQRAQMTDDKTKETDKLRAQHQAEVENVRKELSAALEKTAATHREVIESMQKEAATRKQTESTTDRVKAEQEKRISELESSLQKQSKAVADAEKLTQSYQVDLTNLRDEMEKQKAIAAKTARAEDATKELRIEHDNEVKALKAELETFRSKTSKLAGVETKIADVEAALQASKSAASRNEQDLQEGLKTKDEEKEHLSKVIEDLKDEIDSAQKQLDQESAKQLKEKKAAQQTTERLRKELEGLQRKTKQDAETMINKQAEATKLTRSLKAELAALKDESQTEASELREASKRAEEAAQQMQKQLDALRKEHESDVSSREQALESANKMIETLEQGSKSAQQQHQAEYSSLIEKGHEAEEIVKKLEAELKSLREAGESERQRNGSKDSSLQKVIQELEDQIIALQKDGSDGGRVTEQLQQELKSLQEAKELQVQEHNDKLDELNEVLWKLGSDSSQLEQLNKDLEKKKNDQAEQFQKDIAALKEHNETLEKQLLEVSDSTTSEISRLSDTIATLTEQSSTLEAKAAEAEFKQAEFEHLHKTLQEAKESQAALQNQYEESKSLHEAEITSLKNALDDFQVDASESKKTNNAQIEAKDAELETLQKKIRDLQADKEGLGQLLEALDGRESNAEDLRVELQEAQAVIQELSEGQSELWSAREELQVFKAALQQSDEKYASDLAKALQELKDEHEGHIAIIENKHAAAIQDSREVVEAEHAADIAAVHSLRDALSGELEMLQEQMQKAARKTEEDIAALKEAHDQRVAELSGEVERLGSDTTAKDLMQAEHDKEMTAVHALRDTLDKELGDLREQMQISASRTEDDVEALQAAHADQVAGLNDQIERLSTDLTAIELTKAKHEEELTAVHSLRQSLTTELKILQDQLRDAAVSTENHVTAMRSAYDEQIAELQRALSRALDDSTEARQAAEERHAAELEALRYELESSRLPPTSTKPGSYDELYELQVRCADLEVALEAAREQAQREHEMANSSSPQKAPGLISDKESEDPFADSSFITAAEEDQSGNTWDGRPTVEGTLASIQEQVRQLEELNDRFGQESARWAASSPARSVGIKASPARSFKMASTPVRS